MTELRLTPEANADLEEIAIFSLDRFGRATADKYLSEFERIFEILERYPDSGSIYPGLTPEVRSIRCGSHRIFYRVAENVVTVTRILRFARDSRRSLGGRH